MINKRLVPLVVSVVATVMFAGLHTAIPATSAEPPSRPAVGVNWHAGWGNYSDADNRRIVDQMAAAGLQWVRIDIGWATAQPNGPTTTGGEWYVAKLDRAIDYARSKNLKVLGTWWRSPGWANGGKPAEAAPDPNAYAESARWAAAHWKSRVSAWEIWNEPDPHQKFFVGTTAQYVALLKAAYPKIKQGDPLAQVVLGGPSSNDDVYLQNIYAAGGGTSFDIVSMHPYQGRADAAPETPSDGNRWWFTHTPVVREVMVRNGDADKKIWFTEFGWSSHANTPDTLAWQRGVTEQQQADYFVRAVQYTTANYPYVTNMFWYNDRNRTGTDIQNANYGLLRTDLTPKPAYEAIKTYLAQPVNTTSPSTTTTTSVPRQSVSTTSTTQPIAAPTSTMASTTTTPPTTAPTATTSTTQSKTRKSPMRRGWHKFLERNPHYVLRDLP